MYVRDLREVELGYNVMKWAEYFVYNVMVKSTEIIGTTKHWRYRRGIV